MTRALWIAIAVAASRPAAAGDCVYETAPDMPPVLSSCVSQLTIPAGCPVYVLTPDRTAVPTKLDVMRGATVVQLDATSSIDSTMTVPLQTFDFSDCACTSTVTETPFDLWKVTVAGTQPGDWVLFGPGAENTTATITDPGPCPAAMWPGALREQTDCGPGPRCHVTASEGCTASSSSPLAAVLLIGLIALARRRPRRP